jgi:hypothetical protein
MLIIIWKIQTKQNVKNMLMFKGGNISINSQFWFFDEEAIH